jgi:hypothetical protein
VPLVSFTRSVCRRSGTPKPIAALVDKIGNTRSGRGWWVRTRCESTEEKRIMPNNQVYVAELNRWDSSSAPLLPLRLMRDLEVFAEELCTAEEAIGQPVWTYHDPLVERLRRVGVSNQKVEDFTAWRRTISSLTSVDSRDENQLAKIVAGETAGLTLLAELVASLRKETQQSREATVQSEAIAA